MKSTVQRLSFELRQQTTRASDRRGRLTKRMSAWLAAERTTRPRVLVVDDDDRILATIARALGPDYRTTTCLSPVDALAKLRAEEFDLVVSDVSMPEMMGVELVRELRHASMRPLVPVVLVSGVAGSDLAEFAARCGANACVSKPFDVDELQLVVASLTERTR